MDPALDEDKPELAVLVFPVPLHVLPDAHSLLDQVVQILRDLSSQTLGLQDTQDLVTSHKPEGTSMQVGLASEQCIKS